jgi:hypothetical protein
LWFIDPPRGGLPPFPIGTGARMAIERTLSIIKPDAVAKNVIGKI